MEVLHAYTRHTANEEKQHGQRFTRTLVKPALGLFHGVHNGKLFRQHVDKYLGMKMSATDTLLRAVECLGDASAAVVPAVAEQSKGAAVEALERLQVQ